MNSTTYYIVHKSGRRIKIACIGYSHSAEIREETRRHVAKVERCRLQDYHIENEKDIKSKNIPIFTL